MSVNKSFVIFLTFITAVTTQAVNPKPFTVPEILEWEGSDGVFLLTQSTGVTAEHNDYNANIIAKQFVNDLFALTDSALRVNTSSQDINTIRFVINETDDDNPESYRIDISAENIAVESSFISGLRHGATTLLQIIEQSKDGEIPTGKIFDYPQYSLRGLMIDAGRKYIPLDYLTKLVDVLSYYKMNTLHIHLNDNGFKQFYDDDWDKTPAAFRMESTYFPGLTARDGSYGKSEFREFIKYADSKGVEIIPEFDFPAHSLAFTRYCPEIGSTDDKYGRDHLDLLTPRTYEFLDSLISEYLGGPNPVFTGPHFHIGTDEYSNRDSVIVEKFRGLTDRYLKLVESYGKLPMCWGSLTHAKGVTPVKSDNVTMYCWYTGYANPKDMLDAGYDLVSIPDGLVYIVPKAGYYYDFLDNEYLYNHYTPAWMGGDFHFEERHPQIKGGMFAVWNDHPDNGITVKDIHLRIMSAMPAMSAKTWGGEKVTFPYEEFEIKAMSLSEAPKVNELGRWTNDEAVILDMETVIPNQDMPMSEVGYSYIVEFDVAGSDEEVGTKLFESESAVFWLSDPICGRMGFSHEGKLSTFRQSICDGESFHVKIVGDNERTQLYVNDKLVDDLNIRWISYNGGKNRMAEVHTLVFPLKKAGNFKSAISNLKVTQLARKP
ncbi:MAG: family 20 glycosylhydrolase [Muribaculum sp.]|nr:family 20 glycosylhydrolase [Muribaculum sp.]